MVIIYLLFSPVYMCKALCTCIISKLLYSFSSPPVEKQGIFFCICWLHGARRLLRRSRSKQAAASPPPFHFALQNETRAQPHYLPDSGVLLVGDKAKKLKAASARVEQSARC